MTSVSRAAASGLASQQLSLDLIGNNIANIDTPGFKKSRVNFKEVVENLASNSDSAESISTRGGVEVREIRPIFTSGPLLQTGQPYDMAINGEGFFPMVQADGTTAYTRHGAFQLGNDGSLVDFNGNRLKTDLIIPRNAELVKVLANGTVTASIGGQFQVLGKIQFGVFPNPGGLESIGNSMYKTSEASGDPVLTTPGQDGAGVMASGYLEGSNVEFGTEIINMMSARRAYGISLKSVQTIDEMVQEANSLPR